MSKISRHIIKTSYGWVSRKRDSQRATKGFSDRESAIVWTLKQFPEDVLYVHTENGTVDYKLNEGEIE